MAAAIERDAVDMKRAARPQLMRQPHVVAPGETALAQSVEQAQFRRQRRLGLGDAVKIERHGEMFGDVALPGRRRATIGLDKACHLS